MRKTVIGAFVLALLLAVFMLLASSGPDTATPIGLRAPRADPQPDNGGEGLLTLWGLFGQALPVGVPEKVRLPVEEIPQNPELPNGCEITCAAMALGYLGFPADKTELAGLYLPKEPDYWSADPHKTYMGDPASPYAGWYCWPEPVAEAVNAYLADQGAGDSWRAVDLTGATFYDLQCCLARGTPVLAWVTLCFEDPEQSGYFLLPDGSEVYHNLHCVLVTGYDEETVYFADPLEETRSVSISRFQEIYTAMGSHALAIEPQ